MRLLLLEDDFLIGDGLCQGLAIHGFTVDWFKTVTSALSAIKENQYEICLLDLGLPDQDGLVLMAALRRKPYASIPIIALTARDTKQDKIHTLNAGADDYVTKPFDLDELVARMRAQLRRSSQEQDVLLQFGKISLDPIAKQVTLNSVPIILANKEYILIYDLLRHKNHIRSRAQLEQSLYVFDDDTQSNTIEVYIHNLRRKLGSDAIKTIRGMGYTIGDV
jgi:DNA-binding response OmpR family regulator